MVRIVWKIWISRTVPDTPWLSIQSPTLKGRNSKTISPPAKFCKFPESAIPIATPADANKAANEVVSTPNLPITAIINRIVSRIFTRLLTKLWIPASKCRFISSLDTSFLMKEIRKRPTTKIITAPIIRPPAPTPQSISCCIKIWSLLNPSSEAWATNAAINKDDNIMIIV